MFNNSVSSKSFIIKTLLYGSAITVIVVALLLSSFMPQNVAYADTEESYINFNQIAPTINSSNYIRYSGITSTAITYNNNSFTINNNGATLSGYQYGFVNTNNIQYTSGHRYYISIDILCSYDGVIRLELWAGYSQLSDIATIPNETVNVRQITNCQSTTNRTMLGYISGSNNYPNGSTTYSNLMIIDLTLCFGEEKANTLTVEDVNNIFVSQYYSYTTGTVINESNATDYASGYIDGVNDTLSNFTVNATMGDSYNFLTTVDYQNYISTITKEIITIDGVQHYGCICNGYVKLPFYIKESTSLKLNITAFANWGNSSDNTVYYYIGYIYNGEFVELYNTSLPRSSDGLQNVNFEFFIPVDIDGIVFNCSEQYLLIDITAQYQTYNVQDAIYKAEQRGYNNGHENGYKLGKDEGYELGLRSDGNLLNGGFWNFFSTMINSVSSIFSVQLYGGITIGTLILIPLLFTVLLLVLKLVRGNG